ncbi:MAG TPA: hypothetical protein PKD51_18310 [Saprospiraceae bacterium]|nr:hypothetical protein [Saprospiraceae bacterium]HMU03552.1 hypothetical protein [Saprospiraceae bacterium]
MRELFKRWLNKGENESNKPISLGNISNIKFTLRLGELHIGYLYISEGHWVFSYSEEFKNQTQYARLTGFSDLNKVYKSDELWPFFKIRIPGLKQPMVRDIIRSEQLDESNEAILLRRFGLKTMSNPYILEEV